MGVILILILASLATALLFLGGFIWSVRSGQYEDTSTPSMRVLLDDPVTEEKTRSAGKPLLRARHAAKPTVLERQPKQPNER